MNRTTRLVLVGIVVLSAGVPTVAGQSTELVTLEVTVVDSDGDSVGGTTVVATWDDGERTVTTASNGKSFVDVPEGADVELDVESDEYIRNDPLEIEDASAQSVELTVARQGTATVEVTASNGTPLGNAVVRLWQGGNLVVNTRANADGVLETKTIERGDYAVIAYKEGYYRNRTEITVEDDASASLSLESGSVTVSFSVVDDHFAEPKPVEDATISVGELGTVPTLSNGENTLSAPVNSNHEVTITKDGYETVERTLRVKEEATYLNATMNRKDAITVEPANDRIVVGETLRVQINDEYGAPVEGATVTLDGETIGETDGEGVTTMVIDGAGEHTVGATSGDLEASATVEGIDPDGSSSDATDKGETTDAPSAAETTTAGSGPGFTVGAALTALFLVALARRD